MVTTDSTEYTESKNPHLISLASYLTHRIPQLQLCKQFPRLSIPKRKYQTFISDTLSHYQTT